LAYEEDLLAFLLQLILARFDDAHDPLVAVLPAHKRGCQLDLRYDYELLLLHELLHLGGRLRAFLDVDYVNEVVL